MDSPHFKGLGLQYLDTPPITPADPAKRHTQHGQQPLGEITNIGAPAWTPPASPVADQARQQSSPTIRPGADPVSFPVKSQKTITSSTKQQDFLFEPTECPFQVEIQHEGSGYEVIYGIGAWSTVLKGRPRSAESKSMLLTPPTSPINDLPKVVAIKRPSSKHAGKIVLSEGIILSYMSRLKNYNSHVTFFYGVERISSSLVLAAIPLTLEHYIKEQALINNARSTTWTMSEPAIGSMKRWLDIAHQLITSLSWLHTISHVVHADIKPSNILLTPLSSSTTTPTDSPQDLELDIDFPFHPLYSDFSSSHISASPQASAKIPTLHTTLSALTPPYTAPELLSRAFLRQPVLPPRTIKRHLLPCLGAASLRHRRPQHLRIADFVIPGHGHGQAGLERA